MSGNKKRAESINNETEELSLSYSDLDAKLTVGILVSFALGILSYLSIFDLAGRFGGVVKTFIITSLGRGSFFLPLTFFVVGIILIRAQKYRQIRFEVNARLWWGIGMIFLAINGFLSLLAGVETFNDVGQGGGVVGFLLYPFLLKGIFGQIGGVFILTCILIIGFFMASQLTVVEFWNKFLETIKNPSKFWDLVPDIFEFWKKGNFDTISESNDKDRPSENARKNELAKAKGSNEAMKLFNKLTKNPPEKKTTPMPTLPGEFTPEKKKSKTEFDNWTLPPFDILKLNKSKVEPGDIAGNKMKISDTLNNFGIQVEMQNTFVGPTVTQYTLKPASGVRLSAIDSLQRDLALSLAAQNIRVEAPIAGKSLVGIEIPNKNKAEVCLRDIIQTHDFLNYDKDLPIAIGKDVSGHDIIYSLAKMPHLLVAGATGSGKSVFINGLLLSLLYKYTPQELQIVLVDMKRVELKLYEGVPHLLSKVITEAEKAINALKWTVLEMDRRYRLLEEHGKRNIVDYNQFAKKKGLEELPYMVFIIDELGDLMMLAKAEVEPIVVRLTQMSRAVGIHLVLGTQRPDTHVVTGLIKANVPSRIAFAVASQVDSRVILDVGGAEKLLGQGDGLMITPSSLHPVRFQGPNVLESEVRKCVDFLKKQVSDNDFEMNIKDEVTEIPKAKINVPGMEIKGDSDEAQEDVYERAKNLVIQNQKASTSFLQQMLGVGYPKAAKLIYKLEEEGIVGPANGSKPRDVYVTVDVIED